MARSFAKRPAIVDVRNMMRRMPVGQLHDPVIVAEVWGDMALSDEDVRAIEAVHERWIAVEKGGDARAVLHYCADDIVWMPPGSPPIQGREAILSSLSGPPSVIDEIEISNLAIAGDGRVAWKTCDFVTTCRAPVAASSEVVRGSHLWILRREDDGEWRVVVVTWTLV